MSAYVRSSNPFDEDEEEKHSFERAGRIAQERNASNPFQEDRRQQILREIDESESRQLDSTRRALASIYDSESMGVATAEELVRQGETLDNIEKKTDQINQTMTTSQKHLNSIKSIFGGIKNWWGGSGEKQTDAKTDPGKSRLKETLEREKGRSESLSKHGLKSGSVSGFYEEDEDLDSKFMAGSRRPNSSGERVRMIQPLTHSAQEDEMDENLGLMSEGMARLKGLALGLGDEIESQNEQLDRINWKAEKADDLLTDQNRQMWKILKK